MKIADYVVLIAPSGLPFFSFGNQELKKDPIIIGGFLKALDGFAKEKIAESKEKTNGVRHFQWNDFNITLSNPMKKKTEEEDLNTPLFATLELSGKPHLQDEMVLDGIFEYLFFGIDLETIIEKMEASGKVPTDFIEILETRTRRVIFGEMDSPYKTDGLIISTGTSWGAIFSALQLHNPKFTVFICSEHSEKYAQRVIKTFGLVEKEDFDIVSTNPDDTSQVAKATAKAHQCAIKKLGSSANIMINATGGTKSLTSGIMHYGFVRYLKVCYILSHEFRKHGQDRFYGDEEVLLLDNPVQTVGFFYEKEALEAFNSQNFLQASNYFSILAQNTRDLNIATYFEGMVSLSDAYYNQKQWNYSGLVPLYQEAIKKLKRFCYTKLPQTEQLSPLVTIIENQQELAGKLADLSSETIFLQLYESVNQFNRLFKEKNYYLTLLQGVVLINMILDLLMSDYEPSNDFVIPKSEVKGINQTLSIEIKIKLIKEMNHPFVQYYGDGDFYNQFSNFSTVINNNSIQVGQISKESYSEQKNFINELFIKFLEFTGKPEALKEFNNLQFIEVHFSVL